MEVSPLFTAVSSVRNYKLGKALAAGALATGLLLGASTAQAAQVILDGNNVIGIDNLELDFDQDSKDGFYDVAFINDTGSNLFGSGFDFDNPEDAGAAIIQVNNALNLNNPVPTGASSVGADQFFIPALERFGFWGAFGSEFFSPGGVPGWDACEVDCLSGVTILNPSDAYTYATFQTSAIPVPAAVWLFGSGLLGLIGIARKKAA
jgi:hypothetical protein